MLILQKKIYIIYNTNSARLAYLTSLQFSTSHLSATRCSTVGHNANANQIACWLTNTQCAHTIIIQQYIGKPCNHSKCVSWDPAQHWALPLLLNSSMLHQLLPVLWTDPKPATEICGSHKLTWLYSTFLPPQQQHWTVAVGIGPLALRGSRWICGGDHCFVKDTSCFFYAISGFWGFVAAPSISHSNCPRAKHVKDLNAPSTYYHSRTQQI